MFESEERYLAAGNRWIVHQKGNALENVKKISIYTLKNFAVFRKDFKSSDAYSVATELVVFGDKNRDSYITITIAPVRTPIQDATPTLWPWAMVLERT